MRSLSISDRRCAIFPILILGAAISGCRSSGPPSPAPGIPAQPPGPSEQDRKAAAEEVDRMFRSLRESDEKQLKAANTSQDREACRTVLPDLDRTAAKANE